MKAKSLWSVIKGTLNKFSKDQVLTLGAALAYYAIFSIGPLLVILLGVAGMVFSEDTARQQLIHQIQEAVGPRTAAVVQSMMASQPRGGSLLATILGVVVLLLGASGIFGQLKTSLNQIWGVKPKPGRGILGMVIDRLFSILMVLCIGLLLIASMLMTTFISGFYQAISHVVQLPAFVLQLINLGVSLLVITVLFALIFKLLPDVRIRWRDVWVGAFTTALLFLAGEYLLSWYLGRQGTTSTYGAAGSVVLLLMWIYYSSLILFAGAEFTQVYARQKGEKLEPGKYAVPLDQPEPQGG